MSVTTECCAGWKKLDDRRRAEKAWQLLHQLAHGRIPFSPVTLAELADIDETVAADLMKQAVWMRWLYVAPGVGPDQHRGRLPR